MGTFQFQERNRSKHDPVGVLVKTAKGLYVREIGLTSYLDTPVIRFDGLLEENYLENMEVRYEDGYWVVRHSAKRMRGRLLPDSTRKVMRYFKEDQDEGDR